MHHIFDIHIISFFCYLILPRYWFGRIQSRISSQYWGCIWPIIKKEIKICKFKMSKLNRFKKANVRENIYPWIRISCNTEALSQSWKMLKSKISQIRENESIFKNVRPTFRKDLKISRFPLNGPVLILWCFVKSKRSYSFSNQTIFVISKEKQMICISIDPKPEKNEI